MSVHSAYYLRAVGMLGEETIVMVTVKCTGPGEEVWNMLLRV